MQTIDYNNVLDRSEWREGPWDAEPLDKRQWQDPATGLPCLIKRNDMGTWCGYVGVDASHLAFGMDYEKADSEFGFEVHGGLTYAAFCDPRGDKPGADPGKYICHVAAPGEDRVWWLGFDCAHAWDICPSMTRFSGDSVYRDIAYATAEVTRLAKQLHDVGN